MPDSLTERLDRIETKLDAVASQASNTAGRVAIILAVAVALLGVTIGGAAYQRATQSVTTTEQLCAYVDSNIHQTQSERIRSVRLLFGPFSTLLDGESNRRIAYLDARDRYLAIDDSRPANCGTQPHSEPFPTYDELNQSK